MEEIMEKSTNISTKPSSLFNDIRQIVENGIRQACQGVHVITVSTYWQVGKRIVEEEQKVIPVLFTEPS